MTKLALNILVKIQKEEMLNLVTVGGWLISLQWSRSFFFAKEPKIHPECVRGIKALWKIL